MCRQGYRTNIYPTSYVDGKTSEASVQHRRFICIEVLGPPHAKIAAEPRETTRACLSFITRFGFYQRWFDTVFLLSGCASAVILFFLHLANRSSDADHHHTVAVDGAVSHFRSSLEMESSNQEFSSGPGVSSTGAQGAAVRIRPKGRVSVAGGMKPLCGTGDDLSSTVRSSSSYDRTWVTSRHKPPSKQS